MLRRLKAFLETTFNIEITNESIEQQIKETNARNQWPRL